MGAVTIPEVRTYFQEPIGTFTQFNEVSELPSASRPLFIRPLKILRHFRFFTGHIAADDSPLYQIRQTLIHGLHAH